MILGPIAVGAGLLWLRPDWLRRVLVVGVIGVVCACVLALVKVPGARRRPRARRGPPLG